MQKRNDDQEQIETIVGLHHYIPEDNILKRVGLVLKTGWVHDLVRDRYSQETGRPSIDPESALRLMLSGFLLGIVHDRELMRRAATDIAIRWFCHYRITDKLPHHSSLTRIRQRWGEELFRKMFRRIVEQCVEAGLVSCETIHVDSTLVRANASVGSIVDVYVERTIQENTETDNESGDGVDGEGNGDDESVRTQRKGRERGKSNKVSRSKTDPDVVMVKSRDSQKCIPAYRNHLAVDDRCGVIVDVIATKASVGESTQLIGHIEQAAVNTGLKISQVTADAGYATSANFGDLDKMNIKAAIPTKNRSKRAKRIPASRFKYDAKYDHVVCPKGRKLRRSKRRDEGWVYSTKADDCRGCQLRSRCQYGYKTVRTIYISDGHAAHLRARRMKDRWKKEYGEIYTRHRWMVEGRISEVKNRHGLDRARGRGIDNMNIQLLLAAMAVNLKRLASSLFMPFTALLMPVLAFWIDNTLFRLKTSPQPTW